MEKMYDSISEMYDNIILNEVHSQFDSDITLDELLEIPSSTADGFVRFESGDIVRIPKTNIQTTFLFGYSKLEGNYEEKYQLAKDTVNLDYAIRFNTATHDFILKSLREKPNLDFGALYVCKEYPIAPDNTAAKSILFLRTAIDIFYIGGFEKMNASKLLINTNDRKKLYSAYKKAKQDVIKQLTDLYNDKKEAAFNIYMYCTD